MAHPQNSPRGLFAKHAVRVPTGKGLWFDNYSTSAALINADATGVSIAAAGVKSSSPASALPGDADRAASAVFISDGTGRVAIGLNTSGTTWRYLATTSKYPT